MITTIATVTATVFAFLEAPRSLFDLAKIDDPDFFVPVEPSKSVFILCFVARSYPKCVRRSILLGLAWFLPKLYVNSVLSSLNAQAGRTKTFGPAITFSGVECVENLAGPARNVNILFLYCNFRICKSSLFVTSGYPSFTFGPEHFKPSRGKSLKFLFSLQAS